MSGDACWTSALATHGLALVRSAESGRGLAAARPFAVGEVVLRAAPAAVVLSAQEAAGRCHHCLSVSGQLKRCSGCGHARYCCTQHQRDAWRVHRAECRMLKHTRPRVPGPSMLLCARLLDLAHSDPTAAASPASDGDDATVGVADGSSMRAVRALTSQLDASGAERQAEYAHQAAMLCGLIGEALSDRAAPSVDLAAELLSVTSCNGHTLCNEELEPIGIGLFPLGALTNHDCDPSAAQSFEGPTLVLRALRALAVGDAVTIGYVELAASPSQRRAELLKGYHFECACARCVAEEGREGELARAAGELASTRSATVSAIESASWEAALAAARRSVTLATHLLPPKTPALGIEWLRCAKLLSHLGRLTDAVDAWRHARRILSITHGDSSALVRRLDEDCRAVEGELAAQGRADEDDEDDG